MVRAADFLISRSSGSKKMRRDGNRMISNSVIVVGGNAVVGRDDGHAMAEADELATERLHRCGHAVDARKIDVGQHQDIHRGSVAPIAIALGLWPVNSRRRPDVRPAGFADPQEPAGP